MIPAYDEVYLDKARNSLGRMLEFAVYDLGFKINVFFDLFITSEVAYRFEKGDSNILVGKSGIELAYLVLEQSSVDINKIKPTYEASRSKEYWAGWALAYYQWKTNKSFAKIISQVSILEIVEMYSPYHEMDIRQFVDEIDDVYYNRKMDTNLKLIRNERGLSQRELASLTNIPIRSIQQYEQKQKNINKAQAQYLVTLAKVLCCSVEDLLE